MATILLCDTILFLVLGNYLSRSNSVEDILIHFLLKMRWLVFVLFPWFGVLLWLVGPAKKLHRNHRRRYYACLWFLDGAGITLMLIGVWRSGVSEYGFLLYLWVWIADVLVQHHRDGGGEKQDKPRPDDPTPTGDAVEVWLKERWAVVTLNESERPLHDQSQYAVYHATSPLAMLWPEPRDWQINRDQHYRHVADVRAERDQIFTLTNHDEEQDWTKRPEVCWVVSGVSPRSTSVGDVIYQPETSQAWLVGRFGLEQI